MQFGRLPAKEMHLGPISMSSRGGPVRVLGGRAVGREVEGALWARNCVGPGRGTVPWRVVSWLGSGCLPGLRLVGAPFRGGCVAVGVRVNLPVVRFPWWAVSWLGSGCVSGPGHLWGGVRGCVGGCAWAWALCGHLCAGTPGIGLGSLWGLGEGGTWLAGGPVVLLALGVLFGREVAGACAVM